MYGGSVSEVAAVNALRELLDALRESIDGKWVADFEIIDWVTGRVPPRPRRLYDALVAASWALAQQAELPLDNPGEGLEVLLHGDD